jgi:aryl-alcohol dehydrogenase-like predicted oxidoreductase
MLFGQGDYYGMKYTLDQPAVDELIGRSMDAGINFFDTANGYNNGESERMLGRALGQKRTDVLIATKLAFRAGPQAFNAGIGHKHIIEQAEASLKRLGTDYIDVLLLHNDDPITPVEETIKAMELLQQQGKIRYAGFSNWSAWKAATAIQLQKDWHYSPFVAAQMHYSLLSRHLEHEFVPMAQHHGLGLMVWSPLSSGFLTGKYTRANPEPEEARLNTFDLGLFDRNWAYDVVEQVKAMAERYQSSPATVALAWLLAKRHASTIIVGVSKLSQLEANVAAVGLTLSANDIAQLDALTQPPVLYPQTFVGLQDATLRAASAYSNH